MVLDSAKSLIGNRKNVAKQLQELRLKLFSPLGTEADNLAIRLCA
jgi:hypothetical protein